MDGLGGLRRWSPHLEQRGREVRQQPHPAPHELAGRGGAAGTVNVPGFPRGGTEAGHPMLPAMAGPLLDPDPPGRTERVPPGRDRGVRIGPGAVEVVIHLADQPEGVVVVAQPDMQAMLLDAPVHPASARPLAAELPARLVDGDLELAGLVVSAQSPRRGQTGHPAAEHRDLADLAAFVGAWWLGCGCRHASWSSAPRARAESSTAPWRSTSSTLAAPLEMPVDPEFQVGTMGLGWDGEKSLIVVELLAMDPAATDESVVLSDAEDAPDALRVFLTPHRARQFVLRSEKVVSAGRAPCPLCGEPIDTTGHLCVRLNGYLPRSGDALAELVDP